MSNHSPVELKLAQAYTTLICTQPFYASILLHLRRVEDPGHGTMWTDGKHLGYDPEFVLKVTKDELVAVIAHEICHVAGLHPWREGSRDHYSWNVACDKVVNAIVQESGLTLPQGCIPPVPNKSAEELYIELPPNNQNQSGGGIGETRAPKNEDGSALSEAQKDQQMAEARVMVQQAANAAKRAGKLPAGLKRYLDEALEPRVPWKEILSRFLDNFARSDYSWKRPNRRYISSGLMFPSLYAQAYGQIAMGCDTSGSIDQAQLREICSEMLGCLEAYTEQGQPAELAVAWFDHAVYPQVVTDAAELQPQGGGGTSFRVVFDWLREQQESRPRAIVMVTDGYCSDFGDEPEIPVLWVLTRANTSFKPPFGELTCVLNN